MLMFCVAQPVLSSPDTALCLSRQLCDSLWSFSWEVRTSDYFASQVLQVLFEFSLIKNLVKKNNYIIWNQLWSVFLPNQEAYDFLVGLL